MKDRLETIEWLLSVILSTCACAGMWLVSVFIGELFFGEVTIKAMAVLFVISIVLTQLMNEVKLEVRYRRLLMEAQEQNARNDPEADALCEHLMEAVYDP